MTEISVFASSKISHGSEDEGKIMQSAYWEVSLG